MSGDMQADVKPNINPSDAQPAKGGGEKIQIKVRGTEGELSFQVKHTTKFSKIIDSYCSRKGIDPSMTRFIFDGTRIDMDKTPGDYDMEEDDVVDAMLHQVGGF